jgi:hypothetical protein
MTRHVEYGVPICKRKGGARTGNSPVYKLLTPSPAGEGVPSPHLTVLGPRKGWLGHLPVIGVPRPLGIREL